MKRIITFIILCVGLTLTLGNEYVSEYRDTQIQELVYHILMDDRDTQNTLKYDGFELAIPFILKHEGDRFVNDTDINEVSRRGITLEAFRSHYGYGTEWSIRNITEEQAEAIYRHSFWDKNNLDSIVNLGFKRTATVLMDSEVNIGPHRANKFFQEVLGMPREHRSGKIDELTLCYLEYGDITDEEIYSKLVDVRRRYYARLVRKRPVFEKYHEGWNNRLDAIIKYTAERV